MEVSLTEVSKRNQNPSGFLAADAISHFDSNPAVAGLFLYISLKPTNAAFQKLVQTKEPRCPFQFSLSVACFHCLVEPLSSETMCLECFVFPSGLLYHFLIGWNFFHLAYAERAMPLWKTSRTLQLKKINKSLWTWLLFENWISGDKTHETKPTLSNLL